MLTLSILRHAKSGWDNAELEDFERPLAARGRTAAPVMGAFMAKDAIVPDLVMCSPSVRTRETLDLISQHLAGKPRIVFDDALYLATDETLLTLLQAVKAKGRVVPKHVMLIGHNPGLQDLALSLMRRASEHAGERRALSNKFPTCGLVVLDFDVKRWKQVEAGSGLLRHFVTPKRLQVSRADA